MATPKWWMIELDNYKTIFVPIYGEKCVKQISFNELPHSMKNGYLKHVKNWSDCNEICTYFDSLNPLRRLREISDINIFFNKYDCSD